MPDYQMTVRFCFLGLTGDFVGRTKNPALPFLYDYDIGVAEDSANEEHQLRQVWIMRKVLKLATIVTSNATNS